MGQGPEKAKHTVVVGEAERDGRRWWVCGEGLGERLEPRRLPRRRSGSPDLALEESAAGGPVGWVGGLRASKFQKAPVKRVVLRSVARGRLLIGEGGRSPE